MASRYYTPNNNQGGNGQGLSSIFNNFANSWQNADRTSQARDQQDNANQDQINQNQIHDAKQIVRMRKEQADRQASEMIVKDIARYSLKLMDQASTNVIGAAVLFNEFGKNYSSYNAEENNPDPKMRELGAQAGQTRSDKMMSSVEVMKSKSAFTDMYHALRMDINLEGPKGGLIPRKMGLQEVINRGKSDPKIAQQVYDQANESARKPLGKMMGLEMDGNGHYYDKERSALIRQWDAESLAKGEYSPTATKLKMARAKDIEKIQADAAAKGLLISMDAAAQQWNIGNGAMYAENIEATKFEATIASDSSPAETSEIMARYKNLHNDRDRKLNLASMDNFEEDTKLLDSEAKLQVKSIRQKTISNGSKSLAAGVDNTKSLEMLKQHKIDVEHAENAPRSGASKLPSYKGKNVNWNTVGKTGKFLGDNDLRELNLQAFQERRNGIIEYKHRGEVNPEKNQELSQIIDDMEYTIKEVSKSNDRNDLTAGDVASTVGYSIIAPAIPTIYIAKAGIKAYKNRYISDDTKAKTKSIVKKYEEHMTTSKDNAILGATGVQNIINDFYPDLKVGLEYNAKKDEAIANSSEVAYRDSVNRVNVILGRNPVIDTFSDSEAGALGASTGTGKDFKAGN